MKSLGHLTESENQDGIELFRVPAPDLVRESMIHLHTEGAKQLGARLGEVPGRASLSRWRKDGYPVDRNGPRVQLPYIVKMKKVYSSIRALTDFVEAAQTIQEQVQEAGGVEKWRKNRRRSRVAEIARRA